MPRRRRPLFTAFYRRALPRFLKVKSIIDAGDLGEIRAVRVTLDRPASLGVGTWRVDPAVAGGGHFVDLAAHTLDLLDKAISAALADGYRTGDIWSDGFKKVGTSEMGEAVLKHFQSLIA